MKTNKRVLSGREWLRWWFLVYIWYLWEEVTTGSLEKFLVTKTTSKKYTLLNQRAEKKGPKPKMRWKWHLQMMMMMMDKIIKSKPDRLWGILAPFFGSWHSAMSRICGFNSGRNISANVLLEH